MRELLVCEAKDKTKGRHRDILHTLFDLVAMNISFVIRSFVFYRTLLSPCLRMLYCLNDLALEMVAEETLVHLLGRSS